MKSHPLAMLLAPLLLGCALTAKAVELTVFAAASLTDVLPALAQEYGRRSGDVLRFSFAASSALARQIEAGASADVFVSADEEWMDYAARHGLLRANSRADVAGNTLVLIAGGPADDDTPRPMPIIDAGLPLARLLGDGRLALGDPTHVPAGHYAQAALAHLGLWPAIADRLAPAESVRVALMYVVRGEAPLGIVYATDVVGVNGVHVLGEFAPDGHAPIRYPAAALAGAAQATAALAFIAYLQSPEARPIWRRFGFAPAPRS